MKLRNDWRGTMTRWDKLFEIVPGFLRCVQCWLPAIWFAVRFLQGLSPPNKTRQTRQIQRKLLNALD